MKNPIKDSRIVSDRTFARRLRSFLKDVEPNCAMGAEELDYLKIIAEELLAYQLHTCPEEEKPYHENIGEK